jgi:hypothetical protein
MASDLDVRSLQYYIVSRSKLRHVFFTGPDEISHAEIVEEIKPFPIELIINDLDPNQWFVVKRTLPEEEKDFLKKLNTRLDEITEEDNAHFGRLLGYPCNYDIKGSNVMVFVLPLIGKPIELFGFKCMLTPNDIVNCKALLADLREVFEGRVKKVFIIANKKDIEKLGGSKRKKYLKRSRRKLKYF